MEEFVFEYLLGVVLEKEKTSLLTIETLLCSIVLLVISFLLDLWLCDSAFTQLAESHVDSLSQKGVIVVRHDTLVGKPVADTSVVRKDTLDIITSEETSNTIPGFRVQLMSTQSLSEAMGVRARANSLLSDYNIYIIYDSPYYKIRAGDFRSRYDASQAADYIASHGFPDAWSVPDNVFRDLQKKSR